MPTSSVFINCVYSYWSGLDSVSVWWRWDSWWNWRRWSTECENNEVKLLTWNNSQRRVWPTSLWACCLVVGLTTLIHRSSRSYHASKNCFWLPGQTLSTYSSCFLSFVSFHPSRRRLLKPASISTDCLMSSTSTLPHACRCILRDLQSERKGKDVDLYSAYRQYNSTTKRSDVDHTELPVNTPHLPDLLYSY